MRSMRSFFILAAFLVVMAGQAHALTFILDGTLSGVGGTTFTPGGDFGYVSIVDNVDPNKVDIKVALNDPTKLVAELSLNFTGNLGTAGDWSATGGNIGDNLITVDSDNTGWFFHFDIQVRDSWSQPANPPKNPLEFTLSKTGTNLDPSMFFTTSPEMLPNQIYLVARTPTMPGIVEGTAYGASTVAPVPEPSTLLLLGGGLAGLAGMGWRRRKNG